MAEREVVKIVDVDGVPKPYGDGKRSLLKFRIEDEEHNDVIEVTAFNNLFFPLLKPGAKLDCDIETKPSKSGDFINHNLTQIYIDGKPMTEKKAFAGGGYRESPEARLSIETQVSVKAVIDLAVAGKLPDEWKYLLNGAMLWCHNRLTPALEKVPSISKPAPVATPGASSAVKDSPAPQTAKEPVSDEAIPQNLGELYTAVRKHFPEEQRKALNAKDYIASFKPEIDLKDIPKAWKEIKVRSGWR